MADDTSDPHAELGMVEILLVEDDDADARLTENALRQDHIANNLTRASDAEEALRLLGDGAYRPDLILLDIHLPKMSGLELLKAIRENEHYQLTPVVVLTESTLQKDIVEAYELHANSYIQKPVDFEEFRRVISIVEDFWLAIVKRPPKR